jgi:hypothetical protein
VALAKMPLVANLVALAKMPLVASSSCRRRALHHR